MRSAILLFSFFLVACGQSSAPTRGVPVTFEAACDKANEGKRVMVEGYVDFPEPGIDDAATNVIMRVRPRLAGWESTVGASALIGNGPNRVEMPPAHYKNRNLRLHLADGQVVTYWNKTKVSGTMHYASAPGPGAYTCALADTLYERGSGYQPALPK